MKRAILLVTVDAEVCAAVKSELTESFLLHVATGVTDALSVLERIRPHLILLDLVLQDTTGLELMEQVRSLGVGDDLPASANHETLYIMSVRDRGGLLPAILVVRDQWKDHDVMSGLLETAAKLGVVETCSFPSELGKLKMATESLVASRNFSTLEAIKAVSFGMRGKRLRASLSRHAGNFTRVAEDFGVTRSAPYSWTDQHSMRTDVSALRVDIDVSPSSIKTELAVGPGVIEKVREGSLRVLVVEDLEHKRAEIALRFEGSNCELIFAKDGIEAFNTFKSGYFLCVLTDMSMPRMDGLELIEKIRSVDRKMPIVLLSGFANVATTVAAMNRGAQHVYRYEDQDLSDIVRHVEQLASAHASESLENVRPSK